ncbi:hypothetical protein SeMB42_g00330 [Synchytrium endobioticum]|uniref:Uncharacterized protein n=1 Tax=Synchytrium endobioticum TaxID=286115 RepID=A0A507DRK2_9FUNG|nr:hypothetical protein SeMB42_g00330 [Synchytrium endobioticum]
MECNEKANGFVFCFTLLWIDTASKPSPPDRYQIGKMGSTSPTSSATIEPPKGLGDSLGSWSDPIPVLQQVQWPITPTILTKNAI